jgi:hypothetical protein
VPRRHGCVDLTSAGLVLAANRELMPRRRRAALAVQQKRAQITTSVSGGEVVVDVVSAGDLGKSTVSGTYVLNQNAKRRDHTLPLVALDGAATKTAPTTSGDVASSRLAGVKI